jgi:hypothetical protein
MAKTGDGRKGTVEESGGVRVVVEKREETVYQGLDKQEQVSFQMTRA